MNIQQLKTIFKSQADCEEYISVNGNRCFGTYGDANWYYLICHKCGITPKHVESGLLMTAIGDGYILEWCEHDIILAIDK